MICRTRSSILANSFFFAGMRNGLGFVCVLDETRTVRAFHNVCSHRAAAVAVGEGRVPVCDAGGGGLRFECPYHGWRAPHTGLQSVRAAAWVRASGCRGPRQLRRSSIGKDQNGMKEPRTIRLLEQQKNRPSNKAAPPAPAARQDSCRGLHVCYSVRDFCCCWTHPADGGPAAPSSLLTGNLTRRDAFAAARRVSLSAAVHGSHR